MTQQKRKPTLIEHSRNMAELVLRDMLPTPPKVKILSQALEQKIKIANKQWGKAKDAILDVYNHALADGWTEVEAAKICREKLTVFSPRTIRGILPDESKNQNMKRIQIAESLPQIEVKEEEHKEISSKTKIARKPTIEDIRNDPMIPQSLKDHLESLPMNPRAKAKDIAQETEELIETAVELNPVPAQKEPLSELPNQELEFMEENEEEYDRLMVMKNLTQKLSGMQSHEIGKLISETTMDNQWRRELVNQTLTHRLQIIKRMSPREVEVSLKLAQTLEHLLKSFTDQLHNEIIANKSKQEISGV